MKSRVLIDKYVLTVRTLPEIFEVYDFTNKQKAIKAWGMKKKEWLKREQPMESVYIILEDIRAKSVIRHYMKKGVWEIIY